MIWNDRGLYISPIKYALCISEKKFKKELKRLGISDSTPFIRDNSNATVHYYTKRKTHDECCIVCIQDNLDMDILQVYSLLVHEAVHIWQSISDSIGEQNTHEFEAYCIQRLSQNLFFAYRKLTKKKKKKEK